MQAYQFDNTLLGLSGAHLRDLCSNRLSQPIGICCTIFTFTGRSRIKNEHSGIRKRSTRLHSRKHVHVSAHKILNFPKSYHAKGVLSLPYGNIVEPFEAWYSAERKMSRIDYYGGNIVSNF